MTVINVKLPFLMHLLFVSLFLFLLLACGHTPSPDSSPTTSLSSTPPEEALPDSVETTSRPAPRDRGEARLEDGYRFDRPDAVIELDKELREISGLTIFDDQHLGAIQDEKGIMYKIRLDTGEIAGQERFADNGDFEGIERVGDIFYILRSDGDLYETGPWPLKHKETVKHETLLSAKYDTEGLTYDAAGHRLLIACKEYPGDDLRDARAIYAFDLTSKKIDPTPAFIIRTDMLTPRTTDHPVNRAIRRLMAPLANLDDFKPSAIAIHPHTGHLFVVSSVRKLLIALNPNNELESAWELSKDLFPQPEGLAFLPNGDLFISNEGNGGRATLLRFNYGI